jgi:dihydroanticapsin dehydrogenase
MVSVVVAGGATGIGAAVVSSLRARGDDVALIDINSDAAHDLLSEKAPGSGRFIHCDLSDPRQAVDAVAAAGESLGGHIDVFFYNAGYLIARPLGEWTIDDWDKSEAINLRSPFFMVQAVAPFLKSSTQGRVILTSSTGAFRGHAGMPAYHATKAGVLGLVRSLADELGPAGVTVNAVCPGWVDTPFNDGYWAFQDNPEGTRRALENSIPLRRQSTPAEVGRSILFLMDEAASYITGQTLIIDGGYTAV